MIFKLAAISPERLVHHIKQMPHNKIYHELKTKNKDGETLLHFCLQKDLIKAFKDIINFMVEISQSTEATELLLEQDNNGLTVFQCAKNRPNIIKFLTTSISLDNFIKLINFRNNNKLTFFELLHPLDDSDLLINILAPFLKINYLYRYKVVTEGINSDNQYMLFFYFELKGIIISGNPDNLLPFLNKITPSVLSNLFNENITLYPGATMPLLHYAFHKNLDIGSDLIMVAPKKDLFNIVSKQDHEGKNLLYYCDDELFIIDILLKFLLRHTSKDKVTALILQENNHETNFLFHSIADLKLFKYLLSQISTKGLEKFLFKKYENNTTILHNMAYRKDSKLLKIIFAELQDRNCSILKFLIKRDHNHDSVINKIPIINDEITALYGKNFKHNYLTPMLNINNTLRLCFETLPIREMTYLVASCYIKNKQNQNTYQLFAKTREENLFLLDGYRLIVSDHFLIGWSLIMYKLYQKECQKVKSQISLMKNNHNKSSL